jgi:uncharacterized coiled-coil DUF342 family protein
MTIGNREYLKALRIISESVEWTIVKPEIERKLRNLRKMIRTASDPIQQNRLIGEAGTLSDLIEEVETAKEREAQYAEADSKLPIGRRDFGNQVALSAAIPPV